MDDQFDFDIEMGDAVDVPMEDEHQVAEILVGDDLQVCLFTEGSPDTGRSDADCQHHRRMVKLKRRPTATRPTNHSASYPIKSTSAGSTCSIKTNLRPTSRHTSAARAPTASSG